MKKQFVWGGGGKVLGMQRRKPNQANNNGIKQGARGKTDREKKTLTM